MYIARIVRFEPVPLSQKAKDGPSEGQARSGIVPYPTHGFLEEANRCQQGEYGLHHHALITLTALAEPQIRRVPLGTLESRVSQQDHLVFGLVHEISTLSTTGFHTSPGTLPLMAWSTSTATNSLRPGELESVWEHLPPHHLPCKTVR